MASKNHLKKLFQGRTKWNTWYKSNDFQADLSKASLCGIDLSGYNFSGANLFGAYLQETNLENVNFACSNLGKADLRGSNLKGANCMWCSFAGSIMNSLDLRYNNLSGAKFTNASLVDTDLSNSNLTMSELIYANLKGANLSKANLSNSNLKYSDLRQSNLSETDLTDSILTGSKIWDIKRTNWEIKNIDCTNAFIEKDAIKLTYFDKGEFENKFSKSIHIQIPYPQSVDSIDILSLFLNKLYKQCNEFSLTLDISHKNEKLYDFEKRAYFKSEQNIYDTFICYNRSDKTEVINIVNELKVNAVMPFMDHFDLRPGSRWQDVIGEIIKGIPSVTVFFGQEGIGPWQEWELTEIISEQKQRIHKKGIRIIPVILQNGRNIKNNIPKELKKYTWVDFREDEPDPLDQLIWGITQKKRDKKNKETILKINIEQLIGEELACSINKEYIEEIIYNIISEHKSNKNILTVIEKDELFKNIEHHICKII